MLLNILQYPGRPTTENDPAQMPTVPMGRIPALDLDMTGYFQDLVIPSGPHLPSWKITRKTHEHPGTDKVLKVLRQRKEGPMPVH